MSIKHLLMPAVSARLLSRERLLRQRSKAERARRACGQPHRVHYFHQVDDPYSALAAAVLPLLAERYAIDIVAHVVGPPPDDAAPDRARLVDYSRRDARLLARHGGLDFAGPDAQPAPHAVEQATRRLVAAVAAGRFTEVAGRLSAELWHAARGLPDDSDRPALAPADASATAVHLAESNALRQRLGHYLGATFFYAGEWYWGIDRLHHLAQRLQDLGARRPGVRGVHGGSGFMLPPDADLDHAVAIDHPPPIDFYFSLRSPYSAIVAPRVFELGRLTGAPVRLRYVLPMVMRGLPVPRAKRMYIAGDAAREAFVRGTPFGRINDPLGRPTERGLALIPAAERQGLGQRYVLSFMQGVWAEGIHAGSDRGLRRIAERAGLAWADARAALNDEGWRQTAETHRAALLALGLWGVPSFAVRDTAVWGQDRLWAVQQAVLAPRQNPTAE